MNRLRRIGTSRIVITAIAAVLASAGAAIAASGGNAGNGNAGGPPQGQRGPGGPGGPGGGPGANKFMTYSETHTYRHGAETVIRADAGKIKSVASDSITVTERDGNDVTIALDADTEVLIPGTANATTDDLKTGQRVVVVGEKGKAADRVVVPPIGNQRPAQPNGDTTSG